MLYTPHQTKDLVQIGISHQFGSILDGVESRVKESHVLSSLLSKHNLKVSAAKRDWQTISIHFEITDLPDTVYRVVDRVRRPMAWAKVFTVIEIERAFGNRKTPAWRMVVLHNWFLHQSFFLTEKGCLVVVDTVFDFERVG